MKRRLIVSAVALTFVGLPVITLSAMSSATADANRSVVIAIDASGSMAGDRIVKARDGATTFVRALPSDVAVGVVAFADSARTLIDPSTNRREVEAAIDGIRPSGDTALVDAVASALAMETDRVVVLSDGEDTASKGTMPKLLAMAGAAGIPIDVVALKPSQEHEAVLRALATAAGGTYVGAADTSALAAAFSEVAQTVTDSVTAAATSASAQPTSVAGAAAPVAPIQQVQSADEPAATVPSLLVPLALAVLAAAAVALLIYGVVVASGNRTHRRGVESALVAYSAPAGETLGDPTATLPQVLHERFRDVTWYSGLAARLDLAEISMSPVRWIVLMTGTTFGAAVLLGALAKSVVVGLLVALLVFVGFRMIVSSRVARAIRDFDTELPDFLLLVASGMRSGLSFAQAVDAAAAEGTGQVARQMTRVVAESRLGAPIEVALMNTADRMQSDDLHWTVTALTMQKQVGGNLSTILETAATAVRGRAELRREVRTLSAEGRLSAYVLIGLPIGVFAFMAITRPEYISFFWTQTIGVVSLVVLLVIAALGALWIRSIVRIEV